MDKISIQTKAAPSAIGCYSQAIRIANQVFLSGQIPLDPTTMQVVEGPIEVQVTQVFKNLQQVAEAGGGSFNHIVKLTVYLTDLAHFHVVNEVMEKMFEQPYPARAVIGVSALPKGVAVEVDAVMVLS